MKITGIIWLDEVIEKLERKHHVSSEEVEEVFKSNPRVKRMQSGHFRGEDVYRALGKTQAGRYLVIFFILKLDQRALILSARDMDAKEKKSYAKK